MPVVSCENLCVKYGGAVAVKDVTFDLEQGDYLCIVGENGSGKTTLMKTLIGLIKPAGGQIRLDGVTGREIGYMPQLNAARKNFPANVREIVISGRVGGRGAVPFYSKADKERAVSNMQKLGIADLAKKHYGELSGGEQRRVLLARALCSAERLLLLDEPAAGLDPLAASEMYAAITELNHGGIAVIMVSHDIEGALKHGNKILHMKTSPIFFGTPAEYAVTDAGRAMTRGNAYA